MFSLKKVLSLGTASSSSSSSLRTRDEDRDIGRDMERTERSERQKEKGRDEEPEVTKMYEGTKTFWRQEKSINFLIFEHRDRNSQCSQSPCIEVLSHLTSGEKEEAPPLYLSYSKIFDKLKQQSDLQIGLQVNKYQNAFHFVMIGLIIMSHVIAYLLSPYFLIHYFFYFVSRTMAGQTVSEGSAHAKDLVAKFIFSRISM